MAEHRRHFDDAVHNFDRFRAKVRERAAVVNEQLPELSATHVTVDGVVTATVNADGVLTGLWLTEGARQLSPTQIADAVLRTYISAQRDVAERADELVRPVFGDSEPLRQVFRRRMVLEVCEPEPVTPDVPSEDDSDYIRPSTYRA